MADSNQKSTTGDPTFEAALALLEEIVHDLEDGRIGLAESLSRYEEGVKLLKRCYALLEQAERRIELVTGIDAAGNPVTQPFDDSATLDASQEGLPKTRRKRSAANVPSSEASYEGDWPTPDDAARRAMDEGGSLF
jgi:exodeoxyribonuclease VII small subunit